jgi:hypothetical protein
VQRRKVREGNLAGPKIQGRLLLIVEEMLVLVLVMWVLGVMPVLKEWMPEDLIRFRMMGCKNSEMN